MPSYENTNLWANTLAQRPEADRDPDEGPRERLRTAFLNLRERARLLAAEIPRDLPDFTVHDISHLDALWEMAELVAGSDYHLTPTEAFVLGGAFLIHDLGMGLAAYPEGIEALRREQGWRDSLASAWQSKRGRFPTPAELDEPPAEVERLAVDEMLRLLHAQRAERLALTSWQTDGGETYHLIDNSDFRRELGPTMGRIAHSHWWSVDKLREEFSTRLGAPYGYPRDWTIDPLKLACLLRVADVCHIDARRAPGFLRAIRQPQGVAHEHWVFQEHLHQPQPSEDRLLYTSGHRFGVEEASAWWLCFDTLKMVDRELRQVDALLADVKELRLRARSVVGVEDPERLVPLVPTEGWTPVDARLRVGDVAHLVKRLGGEELYGRDATVPLRELLQNASDAVRARRVVEGRTDSWGEIVVRLGQDSDRYWLEVEDNGIGMSASALTGALLDFGASYWGSSLMRQELPGLFSGVFEPTGKYGIGFFSVFMWGQHVHVITRRPEAARRDTLVLEFETGLQSRPILREATEAERLLDGGTRVRVWLNESPYGDGGLLRKGAKGERWTLPELCGWLAPALDVDLFVGQEAQDRERVLIAGDWTTLEAEELLTRVRGPHHSDADNGNAVVRDVASLAQNLRLIEEQDGTVVGRALVYESLRDQDDSRGVGVRYGRDHELGLVTVGGLRSTGLWNVGGILVGEPVRAARDSAIPTASSNVVAEWATEQARLLARSVTDPISQEEAAQVVRALGGDTAGMFVAQTASGWVTAIDIATQEQPDEVTLLHDAALYLAERKHGAQELILKPNVFVASMGITPVLRTERQSRWIDWPPMVRLSNGEHYFHEKTLAGVVVEALARAWGSSLEAVLEASSDLFTGDSRVEREIGAVDGKAVTERVEVVKRPS